MSRTSQRFGVHAVAPRTEVVLRVVSWGLFCEEPTTLDKELLEDGPRGRVATELLDQVVVAVRRALGDFST